MPSFSEERVSDEELETIAQYTTSLEAEAHAHAEPVDLTAAVEMHHWMALEALKAGDRAEAIHHVGHVIELLEKGEHRQRMEAILDSLGTGETHDSEHEIEEMLAGRAAPDLTLADAQHHMVHFRELASSPEVEPVADILDLLDQGDLHQAEHEIQELLGEKGHHN